MPKKRLGMNVLEASRQRISWTFDSFERVYLSFSAGKDSTVMLHLVADEARKRGVRFGVLLVDLEGQYRFTIEHAEAMFKEYADCIEPYWCCLPISLRNAVSVYEPKWICWDKARRGDWIRELPVGAISDESYFEFFEHGMEFEEFVPLFGEWYSQGKTCACFVGIRTDESLNRFRTIASKTKITRDGEQYTTKVTDSVYNVYPIYDWRTDDIWIYHGKNTARRYNELYEYMHKAGLSIHQARICQPYGDDQRRGLWLYHIIEPQSWARVVARVNGANSGALYVQETGNVNGYARISKPPGHTWKTFCDLLLASLPEPVQAHYLAKFKAFISGWARRGYVNGIPDEAPRVLEDKHWAPSYRRLCKVLLRNDWWCKGLGLTQPKSKAYSDYVAMKREARKAKMVDHE